jgi:hypothetical protein
MPPAFIKALPSRQHILVSDALSDLQRTGSTPGAKRLRQIRGDHKYGDDKARSEREWLQLEYCDTWSAGDPRLILTRKTLITYADQNYIVGWYVPVNVESALSDETISLRRDGQHVVFDLAEATAGPRLTVGVGNAVRGRVM